PRTPSRSGGFPVRATRSPPAQDRRASRTRSPRMGPRRKVATRAHAHPGGTGPTRPERPSEPVLELPLLRPSARPPPVCAEVLAHVEHEIEAPGERTRVLGGTDQQLLAEQAVFGVFRLARKVELRRQQAPAWRRDPHMEMARAALVGTRHDRAEAVASVSVGAHMAAQPEAGIVVVALGVGLPQVDQRVRYRAARPRQHEADKLDRLPRHAGFDQVGALGREWLEEWSFGLP